MRKHERNDMYLQIKIMCCSAAQAPWRVGAKSKPQTKEDADMLLQVWGFEAAKRGLRVTGCLTGDVLPSFPPVAAWGAWG